MTDNPIVDKLRQEHLAMHHAIAELVMAWSALESSLSQLLDVCVGALNPTVALAIYFTPANIETRIDIVDNAIEFFESKHKDRVRIINCWAKLKSRLDRARKSRNSIFHGSISIVAMNKTNRVRLTSPIFDFSKRGSTSKQIAEKQWPGMSPSDVQNVVKTCWGHSDACRKITDIIKEMQKPFPHRKSWQQTLEQLEADLNLTDNRYGQNSTKS